MEPSDYDEFKKLVDNQRKVITKRQISLDKESDKLEELLKGCPHIDLVKKSKYYGGSYYDPSSTDYWMQCTLCGECGPITTETGSF